jgi:hypothetical protein
MPGYESEITQFLNELKKKRPDIEADQRRGRAIWWDKDPIDLDQARRVQESQVPPRAYPYQTED